MNTYKRKTKDTKRNAPIRSNTKEAKAIIRNEIAYYTKGRGGLTGMKKNADNYNYDDVMSHHYSDYAKGGYYAAYSGSMAGTYYAQRKMLRKIYGNKVDDWTNKKVENSYKNLIGREYSAMLREREKAKAQKKNRKTVRHK